MQHPTTSEYTRGALYGLAAASIWAAFIVVSRLGVRTSLTPWDIAAIRFAVAGSILLPYVMSKGLARGRLGWIGSAAIVFGCGAPMVLLVNAGLLFAPAAHAGALFPGVMPLMVAILAAALLGEAFTPLKRVTDALQPGRKAESEKVKTSRRDCSTGESGVRLAAAVTGRAR